MQPFSVINFLANNGEIEALQTSMDGLVVVDDISNLALSRHNSSTEPLLPAAEITLSAWISISHGTRGFSGLIAAATSGAGCTGGFVLGYSMQPTLTVLHFEIALANRQKNTSAAEAVLSIASSAVPRLEDGVWYHIAATYDGSIQRLYLDGELKHSHRACGIEAHCGHIVYPTASYSASCTTPIALTLGSYFNVGSGDVNPHKGLLKEASIFAQALTLEQLNSIFLLIQSQLKASPVILDEYWVQKLRNSHGQEAERGSRAQVEGLGNELLSPSIDFALTGFSTNISLLGQFSALSKYTCRFTTDKYTKDSRQVFNLPAVLSCSTCFCPSGYQDTLTCPTPPWKSSAKDAAATLSVIKHAEWENSGGRLSMNSSHEKSRETRLWQRACLYSACGFVDIHLRSDLFSTCTPWWLTSTSNSTKNNTAALYRSPLLVGTKTVIRFMTTSMMFLADASGLHMGRDIAQTQSENQTLVSFEQMPTHGVYSSTFFHSDDATGSHHFFVAFANFWDFSASFRRTSSIFRIIPSSVNRSITERQNGTFLPSDDVQGYTDFELKLVQQIQTNGARKLVHFSHRRQINSTRANEYIAVANFFGSSFLYPWDPFNSSGERCTNLRGWAGSKQKTCEAYAQGELLCATAVLDANAEKVSALEACCACGGGTRMDWNENNGLNVSSMKSAAEQLKTGVEILTTCATDVAVLRLSEKTTYLVFSVFSNDLCMRPEDGQKQAAQLSVSQIFAVNDEASAGISLIQSLWNVTAARQVSVFKSHDKIFLAFAGEGQDSAVVYSAPLAKEPPLFSKLQTLPLSSSMSVSSFLWGGLYLLVSGAESSSLLLRWDGERFGGPLDKLTHSRNTAGGQILPSDRSMGALHISVPLKVDGKDASDSSDGRAHFALLGGDTDARVFRGIRERVQGLKRPVEIAVSSDGRFVYVAAQESRSIAAFRRNASSGLLTYSPTASYNTDWTRDRANGEFVTNARMLGAGNGFPLRGLSALQISSDPTSSMLVVTSVLDNCVTAFSRDRLSGSLKILTVIRDGDVMQGKVVDGLAGARTLAISADASRLFVVGWLDQSVCAFGRSASGNFTFLGRVRPCL
jgi:hypothetical protein